MSDEVKRYDIGGFGRGMVEAAYGAFYHMDDYDALRTQVDALKARVAEMEEDFAKDVPIAYAVRGCDQLFSSKHEATKAVGKHAKIYPLFTSPQQTPARQVPEGWQLVPVEPTPEMWGGLARDLMMWLDLNSRPTVESLRKHLSNLGMEWPAWMDDETELKQSGVPSKGTRATLIYKAMLAAAPQAEQVPEGRIIGDQININWSSGDGTEVDSRIERVIREIAAMANRSNDSDDYQVAEDIARSALGTALYSPDLLADVLAVLQAKRFCDGHCTWLDHHPDCEIGKAGGR